MATVLQPSVVGKEYPPETYRVNAEATRAYALATNDDNPRYVSGSDLIAPPLFAVVPAFNLLAGTLMDPAVGLPLDRTLHGEQDMHFASPIRPEDTLVTKAKISGVEETSTGETLITEILTSTADGVERVRSRMVAFVRDPEKKRSSEMPTAAMRGETVAEAVMAVSSDQSYRYAEASGDHNPPHVNEDFAKMIGFRTVILQGLCTMAFACKAVVDEICAGDPERLKRLKVRFSKVVYPGDVLTTRIWAVDGNIYSFETTNTEGQAVIKEGLAEVRV